MQLLRNLLFPISLVYAFVVYFRNKCYDWGIFSTKSYNTPIICVGNLSAGGTGKTPMIELLIRCLKDDYKVAVLSRGYRRKSTGYILANDTSTVEDLGDEPMQIKTKFPQIFLAVDANRQNGIARLEKEITPDLILLDDAYQHRKVRPAYSILLTAYDNLYSEDWYLPTGNLRDSKRASKRAQLIVVTKCPKDLKEEEQSLIVKKLEPQTHQEVLFSYLSYHPMLKGLNAEIFLDEMKGKKLTLVTGIANTAPLVAYLKSMGMVFDHLKFKDHHFFSAKELKLIKEKEVVLTTEKDFVRLKDEISQLYYLEISHTFLSGGKELLTKELEKLLTKNA